MENYGLCELKDLYSWLLHSEKVFSEKLVRVAELAKQRQGLVFRSFRMSEFEKDVQIVSRSLYTRVGGKLG